MLYVKEIKYKEPKYKQGDRIRIKPLSWFKNNCVKTDSGYRLKDLKYNSEIELFYYRPFLLNNDMVYFCDKILTIESVASTTDGIYEYYKSIEDGGSFHWQEWMIEGLVEDKQLNEGIKKQDLKNGDTVYYKLTENDNLPQGKNVDDLIKGKIKKIDKNKGIANIKWEDGQTDEDFSTDRLTLNKD
jgi:hypothetical protein